MSDDGMISPPFTHRTIFSAGNVSAGVVKRIRPFAGAFPMLCFSCLLWFSLFSRHSAGNESQGFCGKFFLCPGCLVSSLNSLCIVLSSWVFDELSPNIVVHQLRSAVCAGKAKP